MLFRILPTTEISIYFVLELPIFFLTLHVAIVLLSCWKSCSARSADKKLLTDSPHTRGIDHLLIRRIKGHIRPLKFNYASIKIPLCSSIVILREIEMTLYNCFIIQIIVFEIIKRNSKGMKNYLYFAVNI